MGDTHDMVYVWQSQTILKSVFSFHCYMNPRNGSQGARRVQQALYPLSYPAGLRVMFYGDSSSLGRRESSGYENGKLPNFLFHTFGTSIKQK